MRFVTSLLLCFFISGIVFSQNLPPKQAYAFDVKQIHSGHSLTDPLFFPHWPGQFVNLMTHVRGTWAGDEIGKSTIPGSPMRWRWQNSSGYPDARLDIDEFELLCITEVANLCYEGGSNAGWYLDCIQEQKNFMSLFVNNAWNQGNSGQGAATLLWSNWVNIDGSDGPFRPMLDLLGGEWERIQDYANANRPAGAPHVYMIPGHKMMARLYDDVLAGVVPGITNFNQFFSDNIHTNELGAYAIAMIHYACIFNTSPVGLPHNLITNPPAGTPLPSPELALYIQNMVWDVVTSYPRTGIYLSGVQAVVQANPVSGTAPLSVMFDASASINQGSGSLTYTWDFGDGSPLVSAATSQHVFQNPGTYTTTLTVTNSLNQTDNTQVQIRVFPVSSADTCRYIAYEDFDYPADRALQWLNGGDGFLSEWEVQNTNSQTPGYQTQNQSLTYNGLPTSGRSISGGFNYLTAGRSLDNTRTGGFAPYIADNSNQIGSRTNGQELWLSFLLQKEIDDVGEVSVSVHSDASAWCDLCANNNRIAVGYFGLPSEVSGQRFWSLYIGNTVTRAQVPVIVGQSVFFVVRLRFEADGTQTDVFINPVPGVLPGSPDITFKTPSPYTFRSFAYYGGNTHGSSAFDELRFAASYTCVAPNPDVVIIQPPVAIASVNPPSGQAPLPVTFDGSMSSDPSGSALRYIWDFGDGSPVIEGNSFISHTYTEGGGIYTAKLTVINQAGLSATANIPVNVTLSNGTLPCLTTITSLSKADCSGKGSHIRINKEPLINYLLSYNNQNIPVTNDHQYYDLAPGIYQLVTSGPGGCNEVFDLHIQVDSTTCPGWSPASCTMMLGTNINGLADWEPHRMFRNFLKNTRSEPIPYDESNGQWSFDNFREVLGQMNFDENGYPVGIPQITNEGNIKLRYFTSAEGQNMPPAQSYVLLYEGTGMITLHGTTSNVERQNGKISFDLGGDGTFWFQIESSDPNNHIRNIRIVRKEDEGEDIVANPFYKTFLEKTEPFQVLRAMDLMHTNNNTIKKWEDRKLPGYFTYGGDTGMPLELVIQLANQTKKDIWVTVPHAADEMYIRNMAQLFKDDLDPNITIFLEYSNEVWNWIFEQAQYNINNNPLGLMYGRAYAQKARKVFTVWHEVFGDEKCRVKRVLGIQAGFNYLNEHILTHLSQDEWDYGSPTHYFGLDHGETGNPRLDLLGEAATVQDIMANARDHFETFIPFVKEDYRNIQILGKEVITYEGGQHFVGNVFGIPYEYQQAMWDAQHSNEMYMMYQTMLDSIKTWGCKLATNFSLAGPQENIYGSWGVMDNIDVTGPYRETAPKYQVHIDNKPSDSCIAATRALWNPCIENTNTEDLENEVQEGILRVYPNPGMDYVVVDAPDETGFVSFYDLLGREILRSGETVIGTGSLPVGVYIIRKGRFSTRWVKQ
jgi:PKD repeat protein